MVWEWMVFIVAAAGLVGGCLVPNRWLPAAMPNDKLLHFLAFGGLTLLALRLTHGPRQAGWAVAGLLLAGWLIECLQQLVPDRSFCWRDMAANAAGIAVVALCSLACAAI